MTSRQVFAAALTTLMVGGMALAQIQPGGEPPYRPEREATLKGRVDASGTLDFGARGTFVYLTVSNGATAVNVIVAPEAWLKQQELRFEKGAAVEVTGDTLGRLLELPGMRAREIRTGDKTLVLRDDAGKPKWEK